MTETSHENAASGSGYIDELLDLIRTEARFLEREEAEQLPARETLPTRELPAWQSRPEPLPVKSSYHVNEFLVYDDIEFVSNVYRGLMQRDADESGLDTYTAMLRREGDDCKIPILFAMMEAPEAQAKGVTIEGLRWESWFRRNKEEWWFRRPLRVLYAFTRNLFRNNMRDYSLQADYRRRTHKLQVDRYLERQHELFDFMRAREQQLETEQQAILQKLDRYRRDMLLARQDLLVQQQAVSQLLTDLRTELSEDAENDQRKTQLAGHLDDRLDAFYLQFENECRGDEEAIKAQLAEYLPLVTGCTALSASQPLLDIGSGRGEWLSLLREQGVQARGVDLSPVLAGHCHAQDLEVTIADGIEHLASLENNSLGVITAFHVIEHLPFEQLYSLVEQSHRVLAPGGLLLFETPNPENLLVGSHTFYHDPSHRNPITPTLIEFLLRHLGFIDTALQRLHPYPESARLRGIDPLTERVNGALCGPQDFAISASKPQ